MDIRFCFDVFAFHHLSFSEYCDCVGLSQETAIPMAIRDNHSESSDRMVVRNQLEADTTVYSLGTQTEAYRRICTLHSLSALLFIIASIIVPSARLQSVLVHWQSNNVVALCFVIDSFLLTKTKQS